MRIVETEMSDGGEEVKLVVKVSSGRSVVLLYSKLSGPTMTSINFDRLCGVNCMQPCMTA